MVSYLTEPWSDTNCIQRSIAIYGTLAKYRSYLTVLTKWARIEGSPSPCQTPTYLTVLIRFVHVRGRLILTEHQPYLAILASSDSCRASTIPTVLIECTRIRARSTLTKHQPYLTILYKRTCQVYDEVTYPLSCIIHTRQSKIFVSVKNVAVSLVLDKHQTYL